jgi:UDP-N-acetyl-D-mannosaminuronic acid dehydrogenase
LASSYKKIVVMGLGYVGLPTAAVLASRGVDVLGVDINAKTIELINKGKIHIEEPDLDVLVQSAVKSGHLRAASAPEKADAFIVSVPTPFKENHEPDLAAIEEVAKAIAPVLQKGNVVVLESTVPVGTTNQLSQWLAALRDDLVFPHQGADKPIDVHIAHSPERVLPGRVLVEIVDNDRVVGGLTPACSEKAAELYKVFVQGECHLTNAWTAELVKLSENAYRDVNIAFANELSNVSDALDVNVWDVVRLANRHPRVNILNPGPGVGGHCIAVDPWFIVSSAPEQSELIRTARLINDAKPKSVVQKIKDAAKSLKTSNVACLGLSYKADIDDLRESPAVEIVRLLADENDLNCHVVEPHVDVLPPELEILSNVKLESLEVALKEARVIVLLVDHAAFRAVDQKQLEGKTVIDTRGFWS